MNARTVRVVAGLAAIVVAAVLFVVLQSGDGDDGASDKAGTSVAAEKGGRKAAPAKVPRIVIENGEPVGGIEELSYEKGDQIHFRVESDVADEVHVHGYDLAKDVEAGGTVSFDFPATIEGVFEAELEERKEQIAELRVNP
jgi:hypothetical protein